MSLGLLPTPTVQIAKAAKAIFNVAPGNFYLTQYLDYADTNGLPATMEALANLAGGTDAAFITTVLTNLGLADDAGAQAFMESAVAASGRGSALTQAFDALAGVSADDETYGEAVTAFNEAVTTSVVYSTDPANDSTNVSVLAAAIDPESEGSAAAAASGLNLTVTSDLITGGATDDTINGAIGTNTTTGALADTLQAVDIINGGEGDDTLTAQLQNNAVVSPTITGVESISITAFTDGAGLGMANVSGTTSVTNNNSVVALPFSSVANSVELNINNVNAQETSVTYDAAVNATLTDTQTINLDTVTNQAGVVLTGSDIETVTINSTGATNTIDLGGTALDGTTTLNVTGDQSLSFDDFEDADGDDAIDAGESLAALETLDASGLTGDATLNADLRGGGTVDLAITGSANNDSITIVNLNSDDVIDGGEGTDTVTIREDAALSVTTTPAITNVEVLNFDIDTGGDGGDVTLNATGITALTTVQLGVDAGGGADTLTLTGVSSTFERLELNGDGAAADANLNTVSLTRATTSGTDDSATIHVTNTDSDGNLINSTAGVQLASTVTLPGIENLTITTDQLHADTDSSTQDGGVAMSLTANGTRSLTVVSETLVDLSGAALDDEINTVDASAANGGILLEMDNAGDADTSAADRSVTVTTGSGDDTVNDVLGGVETTISTGAGDDTVVSSGTTDFVGDVTIDVGAGDDTIDLSGEDSANTVAKALTLGAGSDTVIIQTDITDAGANTAGVVIADFATGSGGDKIDLSSTTGIGIGGALAVTNYAEVADGTDYDADTVGGMTVYTANDLATLDAAGAAAAFATVAAGGAGQALVNTGGDDFFVIASNGVDTGLFAIIDSTGTTPVEAEITLLVTFTGVSDASDFAVDNFTDFLA